MHRKVILDPHLRRLKYYLLLFHSACLQVQKDLKHAFYNLCLEIIPKNVGFR